jgi:hypothetical protein
MSIAEFRAVVRGKRDLNCLLYLGFEYTRMTTVCVFEQCKSVVDGQDKGALRRLFL